jgi:hypothetical protein
MPRTKVGHLFLSLQLIAHPASVAFGWMYYVLAALFRRFNMALHDTTDKNVEMKRDNFIGQTDEGMNNVKVLITEDFGDQYLEQNN